MTGTPAPYGESRATAGQRARAYAVHLFTASGVLVALLAAMEISAPVPDARRVLLLLAAAVVIDAADGPLARRWHVKRWAPGTDGRTIDDIVDYLTYTFLPLLLVWRMEWVPEPAEFWIAPALVASLFGFANVAAKDEQGGFFLGFPSYWNVIALYAGIWHYHVGPMIPGLVVLVLAGLTVAPVGFLYPNLAPRPWKLPLIGGALLWLLLLVAMLADYPATPLWLMWVSLLYPALYTVLSVRLWRRARAVPNP